MHIKEIDKFRVLTCLQLFCDLFWSLVCNSYESERSEKTVYGESISFVWPIFVFTIHIFPSDYNCNQSFNMLQGLPHNLTVARLLH